MRRLLVALLVVTGCHKANQAGSSPKDADSLWALAPEGTKLGIVVTPRGLAMVEHGWQDLHAFVEKAPELAPIAKEMDDQLRDLTGVADVKLADFGLTTDKGGAVFVLGKDEVVMVVPVGDRKKFLASAHGNYSNDEDVLKKAVCKTVKNVYACASTDALFAKLGKGAVLRDKLEARGDVEVVAEGIPGMPMKSVAAVAQLERGQIVVRGTLVGLPANMTSQLGAPIKPDLDRGHSAGFGVVNLTSFLSQIPEAPLVAGVTTTQLAKSVAGPLTLSVPAGQVGFDIKIPVTDPAPAHAVVEHCTDLLPPSFGATSQGGTCHVPVPMVNTAIDAWLDGKTLRLGTKGAPAGKAISLTKLGSELAEGSWSFAFWGRGSALAAPALPVPGDALQDPEFQLGMRVMMMVNEMGAGIRVDGDKVSVVGVVRTAWANPDDVVAKLAAFPTADLIAGKGPAFAASLGKAPIVSDTDAGYAGLLAPVALVGMASAVGMEAFTDYERHAQPATVTLPDEASAPDAPTAP
jgi:hypothetical protein